MNIRTATIHDIPALHKVRMSVKENILSDPSLVTMADYINYLEQKGKGWLCEIDGQVAGFAIIDTEEKSVWALFVNPAYEKRGIGKALHDKMLDWFYAQYKDNIWLSTEAGTRAETFYRAAGWRETGRKANNEIIFEITADHWRQNRH